MPCTTILVGKKASHDGSTIIARNDDGGFEAKRKLLQIEGFAFDGARDSDAKIRIGIGDQTSLDSGA